MLCVIYSSLVIWQQIPNKTAPLQIPVYLHHCKKVWLVCQFQMLNRDSNITDYLTTSFCLEGINHYYKWINATSAPAVSVCFGILQHETWNYAWKNSHPFLCIHTFNIDMVNSVMTSVLCRCCYNASTILSSLTWTLQTGPLFFLNVFYKYFDKIGFLRSWSFCISCILIGHKADIHHRNLLLIRDFWNVK